QKIGCDGRIGSGAAIDKCGVCGGNMEICRYVNGIFRTPHLTHDFHTVVIIPAGAGRINITETRNSRSCIALRSARNPSVMFINGKLKLGVLDHSGRYNVAGTQFEYNRPRFSNKGETMIATGPTNEDLEVLLFFQQENPGITYEYTIPKRNAQLPSIVGTTEPRGSSSLNGRNANERRGSRYYRKNYRNRITDAEAVDREDSSNSRRDITTVHRLNPPLLSGEPNPMGRTKWMKVGFGPCSQSCAEGTKSSNIKCIRLSTRQPVSDEYCTGQQKPRKQVRRCNRQACPAYYDVGDWLECSRTCGSGRRTRTVICRQLFSGNFTSAVSHSRCRGLSKPPSHERCLVRVCAHWAPAQEWSPCSSRCGAGTQSRHSVCKSGDGRILPNRECGSQRRPATMRTCDAGPCLTKWFITDWQQCSADCDRGQQRRNVVCINTANVPAGCPRRHQPEASRNCARSSCGVKHEWFAGKWGSCSSNCGRGIQTRKATCLSMATDGTMSVAPETNNRFPCEISEKPALQRPCNTQSCGSRWHYTQWTECSVSCGGGSRTRDVHCLDEAGLFSPLCKASHKPKAAETCNTISCFALRDPNCEDKRSDCEQLKRARLCKYKVFRDDCCATCPNPGSTHTSSLHGR
uniref:PLAC domain-containing protein n=1 Tax=Ciona savignyi TaxID=51511 RepID=H2YS02_CIOSA